MESVRSHHRNRLLAALAPEDVAALEPAMERVPLPVQAVLIEFNRPIRHVIFPESGAVSTIVSADESRIEIGLVGREGLVGLPVVLGADRVPWTLVVQSAGEGLRIAAEDLRAALARRPALFRPLGLYAQALFVQVAQTCYVNAIFDIESRLARWLLMMQDRVGGQDLFLTHEFLSAMLGVRRPGVTVAIHMLEGTGAIRNRRGHIEVRDRDRLLELAGDGYGPAEREYERLLAGA